MTFPRNWRGFTLVILTLAVYLNCLPNQFVWDDVLLIENNSFIRNHLYIRTLFTSDLFHTPGSGTPYYRPLQAISYMSDYAVWGLDPGGYHITGIGLHLVCVLLIWLLMEQVCGRSVLAFLVAALFAVHPVNTNAVTYISGRADPIALAGMLGALWLFRKSRTAARAARLGWYGGSVLLFLAALFSRESALIFPALLFLDQLTFLPESERRLRRAVMATVPFVLAGAIFLLWRQAVLSQPHRPVLPELSLPHSLCWQIPFRTLATDCGLLLWPAHLHMERQVVFGGIELLGLTGLGILLAGGLLSAVCRSYRTQPLIFFGLGWFILALLPTLAIPTIAVSAAEHWLYVPSIGIYLAAGAFATRHLAQQTPRLRVMAGVFVVVALGALAVRTIRRNYDWADPATLYAQTKQAAPYSSRVWNNLGHEYIGNGATQQALVEIQAAAQADRNDPVTQGNLAALYLLAGDLNHAQAKVEDILRHDPEQADAHLKLAVIADQLGDFSKAEREYRRVIESNAEIGPRLQFSEFLLRQGRASAARLIALEACELEPGNAVAFNLLGAALAELNDLEGATIAFEKAAARDRHSPDAWMNLGGLATRRSDWIAAIGAYRRAVEISPSNGRAQFQLGMAHWKLSHRDQAATHLRNAARALPGNREVQAALRAVLTGQQPVTP